MTTTLTLNYTADFSRAEYHDGTRWHPLHPPATDAPRDAHGWPIHSPPMDQPLCPNGGLHLKRATRYRAPSRLLSHLPPFQTLPLRQAPSPIALDLGLLSPDYAGDGFVYLSAASHFLYLKRDTILMIGHHEITDASAIEGAAMALRRAGMVSQAEELVLAAERGKAEVKEALGYIVAEAYIIDPTRPPPPPDQLDPARGLVEVLETARKILMGGGL